MDTRALRRALLLALLYCCCARADARGPGGALMLIGGAERDNNPLLWPEFLRLAGGPGSRVAVFATASGNPERTGALYTSLFRGLGLEPFVVPLSPTTAAAVVADKDWIARVRAADAVFLAGGDQLLYRRTLLDAAGEDTPLMAAMRANYAGGGLVAGTSAGMAVMSRLMFVEAESVVAVMRDGARMGREIDRGLGMMPAAWFVDQHFLTRGRFGRALVAMQQHGFAFGLGVDEDTALVVEQGRRARVVGYRGVVVMDAGDASRDAGEPRFNWRKLRLSFLSHDDRIDLQTLEISVGPAKRDEFKVDPRAQDFRPYYPLAQFHTDIFANSALLDVMVKLVDGPFEQAIGLAFDGAAASRAGTPGFELRFWRDDESVSWDSPTAVGDPNTVLNVRLDIRPVDISGPLYR